MSYVIKLTPSAQEDVKRLPSEAAVFVERQLRLLAEHPTALSKRSHFPYPPTCQLYEFHWDLDADTRQFFHVLFNYGADEQTIYILGIAQQQTNYWWGKEE